MSVMPKLTLTVPKKPTDTAAMWSSSGRRLNQKVDGFWIEYRDVTIGPFPNKTEASWYDGQVQDVCMGVKDKDLFAGRIFPFGDAWYVERWETNDGPFTSLGVAYEHRETLYEVYNRPPEDYVGIAFQQGEGKFWVDRGNRDSGPFISMAVAEAHRAEVRAKYKKCSDERDGLVRE